MPKARQQYFADEIAINKEARTFTLDSEILDKIDNIDGRAEENVIEIVKVNSVALPVDANKAVDVTVPLVEDNLTSTSTSSSLSANQGRILYDYILSLQSRGRFLSNWDAANWVPVTAPFGSWYNYNSWDYYIVWVVDTTTNYRPDWPTYITGAVSTVVEAEQLDVWDMYVYDWAQWTLLKNSWRQIAVDQTLSTSSINPVENRVITNALNTKQNILTAGANIQIVSDVISATDTTYSNLPAAQSWVDDTLVTTGDKYVWNNKQDALQAWANIQIVWNTISATDTIYWNLPAAQGWVDNTLVTTGDKYNWNNKQDSLSAWQNITISWWVISATDTTYSAGTNITIDNNNVISAQDANAVWGNITWNISNQSDLTNALNAKQDKLTAWQNITINGNVISATPATPYAAWAWIDITWNIITNTKQFNPTNDWLQWQTIRKTENGYQWEDVTVPTYEAWSWINITWVTITNTKQFNPENDTTATTWQVLKKTDDGYRWSNEVTSAVKSVNWMTGHVSVEEFIPENDSTANVGQVLKKTSTGYKWQNESWGWGWGGWGWTTYYAWYWININSSNEIVNTKPFEATWGSVWQVLTKTANGYQWASSSSEQEVKVWNIPLWWLSQSDMHDITQWCDSGSNHSVILKYGQAWKQCFVYWWHDNSGYYFMGTWVDKTITHAENWDFTTMWHTAYKITYDGTTYTGEQVNYDVATNYLVVEASWYSNPYRATAPYQPATKAYVDETVNWVLHWVTPWVPIITNNTTWTTHRVSQIWVGTQAQYNTITPINWVIYNIIAD